MDRELAAVAELLPRGGGEGGDPATVRARMRAVVGAMGAGPVPDGVTVTDRVVPGPSGAPGVPVRVYEPTRHTGPWPALVYFHGGGFVAGDLDSEHGRCLAFAHGAGCVVVSVDYRLAPEHTFPAAVDDAFAALGLARRHRRGRRRSRVHRCRRRERRCRARRRGGTDGAGPRRPLGRVPDARGASARRPDGHGIDAVRRDTAVRRPGRGAACGVPTSATRAATTNRCRCTPRPCAPTTCTDSRTPTS